LKIAPEGFELLSGNSKVSLNKEFTENAIPVLSSSLGKILQKYPDLRQLVKVWPNLPENVKTTIKSLEQTYTKNQKAIYRRR
jgi:hypothetical protein